MRRLILACCLLLAATVHAHHLDHREALHMSRNGEILPAQQLLEKAAADYPDSRLLEMKLKHKHGRYLYKLQLRHATGRVQKLYYDARSGELLREKNYKD